MVLAQKEISLAARPVESCSRFAEGSQECRPRLGWRSVPFLPARNLEPNSMKTNPTKQFLAPATIAAALLGSIPATQGALLFYEGFNYTNGAVMNNANQIGGWQANNDRDDNAPWSNTGDPMMVHDGVGETWNGVFTSGAGGLTVAQTGNFAGANPEVFDSVTNASQGASDHLFAHKTLSATVTTTFADGTSTWFSFIGYRSSGTRQPIVSIGASPLTGDRSRTSATGTVGQNIGMGGVYNAGTAGARTWAGGANYVTGTSLGNFTEALFMARIDWAATGTNDTITVVAFADNTVITEAAFNAATQSVLTADFDQSAFDTLSIGNQQFYVDEIRIATTFADAVTGTTVVPEPSSALLVGLGFLVLLRRRR
jgi:hypothetical protein